MSIKSFRLIESYGNHSNRLFQNAHIEAYCLEHCLEHCLEYRNLTINDLVELYALPPQKKDWLDTIFNLLNRMKLNFFITNLDKDNKDLKASRKQRTYIKGWGFRQHELTVKYRSFFQKKYSLNSLFFIKNPTYTDIIKKQENGNIIVGIHIRRGDYKTWKNGKYYYENVVYENCIGQVKKLLSEKFEKEISFIIFSNESSQLSIENLTYSTNEWFIDQRLMMECNFLIGPPSTFTSWASYIGETPLLHIESKSINIQLEDFKIANG